MMMLNLCKAFVRIKIDNFNRIFSIGRSILINEEKSLVSVEITVSIAVYFGEYACQIDRV